MKYEKCGILETVGVFVIYSQMEGAGHRNSPGSIVIESTLCLMVKLARSETYHG